MKHINGVRQSSKCADEHKARVLSKTEMTQVVGADFNDPKGQWAWKDTYVFVMLTKPGAEGKPFGIALSSRSAALKHMGGFYG
jgi:hypothetical protein